MGKTYFMSHLRIFSVFLFCATLLSSCATSDRWIVDDVYDVKSAMIPVDTDVNDETDYNAYVYKKTIEDQPAVYVDQYNVDQNTLFRLQYIENFSNRYFFSNCGCANRSFFIPSLYYQDQFYSSIYGCNDLYSANNYLLYNGAYYNPYYGNNFYTIGYYGNGYYGNSYWNSNYQNWNSSSNGGTNNSASLNPNRLSGPRGSISGFGGVTSRQANVLKSTPPIGRVGKELASSSNSTKINENVGSRNERVSSIRSSSSNVKRPSGSIERSTGINSTSPRTIRPTSNEATPSRNGSGGNVNSLPRNSSPSENRGGRSTESGSGGNPSRNSGGSGKPSASPQKVGRP